MKPTRYLVALSLALPTLCFAAPKLDDYTQGMQLETRSGRPLAEMVLPDIVYENVTREDLGDVRVFNANGVPVPHAFCAAPTRAELVVVREPLSVFEVQGPSDRRIAGAGVEVQTAAGTQIRVHEAEGSSADGVHTVAHVIDARSVDDLRAIEFDWTSPDGASQARVRVEASTDLDRWRTIVDATTLLRVTQGEHQLQRNAISLPSAHYDYLRIARVDGGPPLRIAAVIGEHASAASDIEPVWFNATPLPNTQPDEVVFDAGRTAPITFARVVLPIENSSVHVRIQSRPNDQASWRDRWSGEVYSISNAGERRVSPPARLDAQFDRFWRIAYNTPSAALNPPPTLELGYRPANLRFLAQGSGPFTLAFGSRRAEPAAPPACGNLLSGVSASDMDALIGEATPGATQTLGGPLALKPLPVKTPVRLVVLWAVLIAGALGLIAAALSLLKRLKEPAS